MGNTVSFNINIPSEKKEIITAFKGLINAFKRDINVKENISQEPIESTISYNQAKADFFSKYAGSLQISDNVEQEYNKYRVDKYGK